MVNLKLKINDPVRFYSQRGLEKGFIASVYGTKATVVAEDGTEFDVPILILKLLEGVKPKRVYEGKFMLVRFFVSEVRSR